VFSTFENPDCFNEPIKRFQTDREKHMNVNQDLVGKTITGVIATRAPDNGPREIWMLQFADGSHVEFVSPGARQALRRAAGQGRSGRSSRRADKTCLEPAANQVDQRPDGRSQRRSGQPVQLADSRSMRYQRDPEAGMQLSLNVA